MTTIGALLGLVFVIVGSNFLLRALATVFYHVLALSQARTMLLWPSSVLPLVSFFAIPNYYQGANNET